MTVFCDWEDEVEATLTRVIFLLILARFEVTYHRYMHESKKCGTRNSLLCRGIVLMKFVQDKNLDTHGFCSDLGIESSFRPMLSAVLDHLRSAYTML